MATKRILLNKSDGTSSSFDFTVPETAGNYALKFNRSDGSVLDAGSFIVGGQARTYNLKFGLSDGNILDVGSFTTPEVDGFITLGSGEGYYKVGTDVPYVDDFDFTTQVAAIRITATASNYVEEEGYSVQISQTKTLVFDDISTMTMPTKYFDMVEYARDENGDRVKNSSGSYIAARLSQCGVRLTGPFFANPPDVPSDSDDEYIEVIIDKPSSLDSYANATVQIDKVEIYYDMQSKFGYTCYDDSTGFELTMSKNTSGTKRYTASSNTSYVDANELTSIEANLELVIYDEDNNSERSDMTLTDITSDGVFTGSFENKNGKIDYTITVGDGVVTAECSPAAEYSKFLFYVTVKKITQCFS